MARKGLPVWYLDDPCGHLQAYALLKTIKPQHWGKVL